MERRSTPNLWRCLAMTRQDRDAEKNINGTFLVYQELIDRILIPSKLIGKFQNTFVRFFMLMMITLGILSVYVILVGAVNRYLRVTPEWAFTIAEFLYYVFSVSFVGFYGSFFYLLLFVHAYSREHFHHPRGTSSSSLTSLDRSTFMFLYITFIEMPMGTFVLLLVIPFLLYSLLFGFEGIDVIIVGAPLEVARMLTAGIWSIACGFLSISELNSRCSQYESQQVIRILLFQGLSIFVVIGGIIISFGIFSEFHPQDLVLSWS